MNVQGLESFDSDWCFEVVEVAIQVCLELPPVILITPKLNKVFE